MDTAEQGNERTAGAAEQARRERREGDESRRNELGFGWYGTGGQPRRVAYVP